MMNKKQWTALLFVYVGYLCFGASIFHYLELREEDRLKEIEEQEYNNITDQINLNYFGDKDKLYDDLSQYCGKKMGGKYRHQTIWDYYNSFFFVVTVVSTIGYGNLHPSTALTRILMIFYAIIGIPLNGILLTSLAQFFSNVFIQAHKKYKRYESRFGLTVDVLTYLIPGFLLFIFLPAGAFMYFEDWTFDMAVYYAFVTLTTIGFGDLVAGQKAFDNDNYLAYQIILMCWIIFGLGYLIMLLGFVTRAMSSKKMIKLEHKLVEALTHNKLWNGISKDIGILRRLINELNLDKIKPVFQDDDLAHIEHHLGLHKSASLPDLTHTDDSFPEEKLAYKRQRAMSCGPHKTGLTRVFSENDLLRIDRKATFGTAALLQPTELLRQVVDALGGPMAEESDKNSRGIDMFSDDEVLESEEWKPSLPVEFKPRFPRSRALSECPAPTGKGRDTADNEWTWSGPTANNAQNIINHQRNKENISDSERHRRWMNPLRRRKRVVSDGAEANTNADVQNGAFLVVPNLQNKRRSLQDGRLPGMGREPDHYMTHTAGTGTQGLGLHHRQPGLTRPEEELLKLYSSGDHVFSSGNRSEILEETSIADFLRVLTSLHSRVGERLVSEDFKPRRKLGTASLTPPRINSLLNLFPEPTAEPLPKPRRKFSLMPNIFVQSSSRRGSSTEGPTPQPDKTTEQPSNLKRFGRFLLRSYSLTPKDSNLDLSLIPGGKSKNRDYNSNSDIPNIVIQIDSPQATIRQSEKDSRPTLGVVFGPPKESIRRSNTIDPASATSRWPRMRRGSTPSSSPSAVIDLNPSLHERLNATSGSTESVFIRPNETKRYPMVSPRWRRGSSAKSSLSDVKECQ